MVARASLYGKLLSSLSASPHRTASWTAAGFQLTSGPISSQTTGSARPTRSTPIARRLQNTRDRQTLSQPTSSPTCGDSQPHDYPSPLSTPSYVSDPASRALLPTPFTPPYHRGRPFVVGLTPLPVRYCNLLPAYPLMSSPVRAQDASAESGGQPFRIQYHRLLSRASSSSQSLFSSLGKEGLCEYSCLHSYVARSVMYITAPFPNAISPSIPSNAPTHPYPLHLPTTRLLQQRLGTGSRLRRNRAPRSRSIFRVRFSFRV
jgi:hypothetical protein